MAINRRLIEFVSNAYEDGEHVTYPDFAKMFALEERCTEACGRCPKCVNADGAAVFSPRNAVLMYESTEFLYDHFRGDGDSWDQLKAELPRIARSKSPTFYARFVEIFARFNNILREGDFPRPTSTAEEVALVLTFDEMDSRVQDAEILETGERKILRYPEYDQMLPKSEDDFNTELLGMVLTHDEDVRSLYEPSLDGIENEQDPPWINFVNLHPDKWFNLFWPDR